MIVVCDTQQTPEWYAARRGHVTASRITEAMRRPASKTRQAYMLELVLDWEGVPDLDDHATPPWFAHGIRMEQWALGWYAWHTGNAVQRTGFVTHDLTRWFGCSPDGLIGDEGLLEIKCHRDRALLEKCVLRPPQYVLRQLQAQMFVTGRRWVDLVDYTDDGDAGHIRRYSRNEDEISIIVSRAYEFYRDARRLLYRRSTIGNMTAMRGIR